MNVARGFRGAIERLIGESALWKRAKGLTLASFTNLPIEAFEQLVSDAGISETWVANQLAWLRGNIRRNHMAQRWYQVFLQSDDIDVSWGGSPGDVEMWGSTVQRMAADVR